MYLVKAKLLAKFGWQFEKYLLTLITVKTFLLPFFCLLLFFSSCKKKADGFVTPNTISAVLNGQDIFFNNYAVAGIKAEGSGILSYVLSISGTSGTGASRATINLAVLSYTPIVSGVYVASDNGKELTTSQIIYEQAVPGSQLTDPFITDNNGHYPTTITITSISSTNVQGTFSGTLIDSQDGPSLKSFTNGTFNVIIK